MLKKKMPKKAVPLKDLLHTGSTLLNLACSGKAIGGFAKGMYYLLVGDSASGKTFLSLTCFAEACKNKHFDDYRLIYDNSENGALMDIDKFFGVKVGARMEAPSLDENKDSAFSHTIEEFYYHIDDAIKDGRPFIYVLDSIDSLSSEEEGAKFEQRKEAYRKGKDAPGSYTDGKAKKNASNIRRLLSHLRKTGSILIIINQTRDNIGFGFEKKTRSGGWALEFYACLIIWSSIKQKIKKTVKGKPRQLGILANVRTKKNRLTGRDRSITMPIYHSCGIDDVGSCVDYLVEEGHWKKGKSKIQAPEFELEGDRDTLIKHIEKEGMEKDLALVVEEVWNSIEEACKVQRKKRYE